MIHSNIEGVRSKTCAAIIGSSFGGTVMNGFYGTNPIKNDPEFRDEVFERLKAYAKALEEVLVDAG